jgi:DnaJ like chaperone protein
VDPAASFQAVRVAFTTRLKEYHPDRVAHLGQKLQKVAEEEIKHINLAYETLKDPGRRNEYLRRIGKCS